ncbi:MAG: DUF4381 family protein [Proteobacteria bacterium]|nr:DUF4381 family protein [Pseudomonadota bacterium]
MNAPSGPVLRDIHLPPPPGWWPPAPGWWMLLAIALAACAFALYKTHQIRHRRRRIREVLREFEACVGRHRHDPVGLAAGLSVFLRRLALRDSQPAAAYGGERWLAYLDGHIGGEEFRHGAGRVLLDAPFRAHADFDTVALIALVRRYVRNALQSGAVHV